LPHGLAVHSGPSPAGVTFTFHHAVKARWSQAAPDSFRSPSPKPPSRQARAILNS